MARRDHAAADLRRKLSERGYDREIVAGVVDRLIDEHLLDDRRYVDNFVSYHAARGQGPLRVRAELRRLGLQGAMVEDCIAAFPDWIDRMHAVRRRKFGNALPANFADKQRQARFLDYRGFTGAQIRTALGFDTDLQTDNEES